MRICTYMEVLPYIDCISKVSTFSCGSCRLEQQAGRYGVISRDTDKGEDKSVSVERIVLYHCSGDLG